METCVYTSALRRLGREFNKFKASLGYTSTMSQKRRGEKKEEEKEDKKG